MNTLTDRYTQLEATLALSGLEILPSEVHGTLIGCVANHLKTGNTPDLLKLIDPEADGRSDAVSQLNDLLYELYRECSEQLFEGKENYDLMLLDDDESLQARVEGLASWARGYVLGLLYNDAFSIDQLPESGPEIARDIMEIAEAAAGAGEETEEDWAFAELHEYVKVGTQLIFEFIYSQRSSDAPATQH